MERGGKQESRKGREMRGPSHSCASRARCQSPRSLAGLHAPFYPPPPTPHTLPHSYHIELQLMQGFQAEASLSAWYWRYLRGEGSEQVARGGQLKARPFLHPLLWNSARPRNTYQASRRAILGVWKVYLVSWWEKQRKGDESASLRAKGWGGSAHHQA